jgi:hypothetical protein
VGLNEDVAAYAQELADAAGITDATARDAFIKNDKIQAKVRTSIEATLREKGRAEAEFKKRQEEYAANLKIAESNAAVVNAAEAKVKAYVAKFGELPDGGDPNNPGAVRAAVADAIDKKTFDERIKVTEGNTIGLVKSVAKITAKHLKDFNEEPDLDAIEKLAVDQGLTAEKAYAEWRKPKDEARAKEQQEAALKKAREEGELEGRSKIAAGAITSAEPASPFMANLRKGEAVKDGPKDSFIKGWRESAQATQKGAGT